MVESTVCFGPFVTYDSVDKASPQKAKEWVPHLEYLANHIAQIARHEALNIV